MSIIVAVLVFGLIVLIHEFGHFIVAKKCGIGVIEFSIGMGPRVWSFDKGETRYSLKLLPFGGSCMMLGEDENESDPKAFNNKSVWARIAVVFAGPLFNFLLAMVLGIIIVHAVGFDSPTLTDVQPGFSAEEQGMQAGDVITKLNHEPVVVYRDITIYMMLHPSDPVDVEFKRLAADGVTWEKHTVTLTPRYSDENGRYMLGIVVSGRYTKAQGICETLKYGIYEMVYSVKTTIKSLGMMIHGQVGRDDVAGPVRMVSMIDETVEETIPYGMSAVILTLMNLCMLLSANLGVMNLLPIPALDGGRLVFLILEVLRGRPIDKEKEGMVHMAGMAALMVLMGLVLFNDISILFKGV